MSGESRAVRCFRSSVVPRCAPGGHGVYPRDEAMAQLQVRHAYQQHLMRGESSFGYETDVRGSPAAARKALWALAISHSDTAAMIMRQLAQVGGICSLKAANLRQLSSREVIGFDM